MWVMHFLSLVAFLPTIPASYRLDFSLWSLAWGTGLSGVGVWLDDRSSGRLAFATGGLFGIAVAVMHHVGMRAYEPAAIVTSDPRFHIAAAAVGIVIGTLAFNLMRRDASGYRLLAAATLTATITIVHLVSMAGLRLTPTIANLEFAHLESRSTMAMQIVAASLLMAAGALFTLYVDARDRRREVDAVRARSLADASFEGLIIIGRDGVIAANRQFRRMTGMKDVGRDAVSLVKLFGDTDTISRLEANPGEPLEAELACGEIVIPVEAAMKHVEIGEMRARAIAIRDLRKQRDAEERIRQLANYDPLTGLSNRRHFYQQLDELLNGQSTGKRHAILCLDLDRLKSVNDLFGHCEGDRMIKRFADILKAITAGRGYVARLGGDEFAVALPHLCADVEACQLASSLMAALEQENASGGHEFELSASIGIAFSPNHGTDKEGLLTAADIALYRAKSDHRGSYRVFETSMGRELLERRQLENDLKLAVARDELSIVYQPQLDAQSSRITGYEALVRWRRRGIEDVPPAVFIPLAERCGAIFDIDDWVLAAACREAAGWPPSLSLAVNVSPIQIASPGLVRKVQKTLTESGMSPSRLQLEVTETALVQDLGKALHTLGLLKAMGIRIVMDDFGTGYSSLANLQAFPFDKIKIDRSFVQQIETDEKAATIVRAVLAIGRGLGVPILAEGVETEAGLAFLRAQSCDQVQGFLTGAPSCGPPHTSTKLTVTS